MDNKESMIKISFTFEGPSGVTIDLDEMTRRLALKPTMMRTLDNWPEAIKHPSVDLPDNLKPRCCWTFEIDYEDCLSVRNQFEKLIDILHDRTSTIKELKEQFGLKTHFEVIISAHHDRMPEIFFTAKIIEFIAHIEAEVGVDMYLD
jgi:hypothetical protein